MQRLIARFAPTAAFWLLALAATVSGYSNPYLAAILAVIGAVLLLWPAARWLKGLKRPEFTLMPDAARRTYDAMRQANGRLLTVTQRAAMDNFGGSMLAACADRLFARGLAIHGEPSPSTVRQVLDADAFFDGEFSEDATRLVTHSGNKPTWINLAVKEKELLPHLEAIRSDLSRLP